MIPKQHADVEAALLAYWTARDEATIAQQARGTADVGGRAGVTSGGHLDRVAQLLARVCRIAGAPVEKVSYRAPQDDPHRRDSMTAGCTLPGYYRPTKDWDLVVWADDVPIVAVELKSQNGPSYGNNANNRAEEALGNAVDLRRAREAGLLPVMPWVGYAYVIEDDVKSAATRGHGEAGRLPKDPHFKTWSYKSRVRDLTHRMVEERLYNAGWAVATSRPTCPDAGKSATADVKCPQRAANLSEARRIARKTRNPALVPNASSLTCSHAFGWHELDPSTHNYTTFIEGMMEAIGKYYPGVDTSGNTTLFDY